MPAVLVLRALGLGDLLVAVPALRALRRALPGHRLVLAAPDGLRVLAERAGAVLLPTAGPDAIAWSGPAPDVAVNLHGAGPQSHRALDALGPRRRIGFAPAEGAAPGWDGPAWVEDAGHERERWCSLLEAHGVPADPGDLLLGTGPADGPAVVHPGAAFGSKRWPADRFAAVAAALRDRGHDVVVTGSVAERPLARAVARGAGLPEQAVLAGRTSLAQLCAVVARSALVVCGDTGVAHVASAWRVPSVVLFGPVGPERWGPPAGGPHEALTRADRRRGDRFAADPDPALLAVDVAEVLAATLRVAGRPPSRELLA
jgi:ADP-heptose:LPS heptosyltransferase